MLRIILWLTFLSLSISACAPIKHLQISDAEVGQDIFEQDGRVQQGALNKRWWLEFEDNDLSAIIEQVLASNYDIRIALKRLQSVQQDAKASSLAQFPRLTAEAGYTDERRSLKRSDFPIVQRDVQGYNAAIAYDWELDLFGRVNKQAKLDKARSRSQQADLQALQSMLVANTVRQYIAYRSAQLREKSVQKQLDRQQQRHQLNVQLRDLGQLSDVEVLASAAAESLLRSQVLALQGAYSRSGYELRVLAGGADIEAHLNTQVDALPLVPESVILHSVSEVLQQRPDIVAAQFKLHAAVASYQITHSLWWPRISLNGSLGYVATDFDDLGSSASSARIFNPRLQWSALNFLSLRAKIKSADRQAQVGLLQYEQTVNRAVNELQGAIKLFGLQEQQAQAERLASAATAQAEDVVVLRFTRGLGDQFDVFDSQDAKDQSVSSLIEQESQLLLRLVDVYRAAGA